MSGLSTNAKIMKFIIVACNTLSFFFGLAIFILGILESVHFEIMFDTETLNLTKNIAIGAIVHGFVIIVAAFLGVYGALRANANVLIAYAVIALLIGCSTLCFLIYAFVQRNAIMYTVDNIITKVIRQGRSNYGTSKKWTDIIDWIMVTFDCIASDKQSYTPRGDVPSNEYDSSKTHCEVAIVDAIEAEWGTIGGCLIAITFLSFFASAMGFALARNIKAYEKV